MTNLSFLRWPSKQNNNNKQLLLFKWCLNSSRPDTLDYHWQCPWMPSISKHDGPWSINKHRKITNQMFWYGLTKIIFERSIDTTLFDNFIVKNKKQVSRRNRRLKSSCPVPISTVSLTGILVLEQKRIHEIDRARQCVSLSTNHLFL
jgi:hypothetical protein